MDVKQSVFLSVCSVILLAGVSNAELQWKELLELPVVPGQETQPGLAGVFAGRSIVQYAQIAVMELMVIQIMTGFALLKLPGKLPEIYSASRFKLGKIALRLVCAGYIVFSAIFLIILVLEQPDVTVYGLIFIAIGCGWYFFIARKPDSQELCD